MLGGLCQMQVATGFSADVLGWKHVAKVSMYVYLFCVSIYI